jgi:hypothetical protein
MFKHYAQCGIFHVLVIVTSSRDMASRLRVVAHILRGHFLPHANVHSCLPILVGSTGSHFRSSEETANTTLVCADLYSNNNHVFTRSSLQRVVSVSTYTVTPSFTQQVARIPHTPVHHSARKV